MARTIKSRIDSIGKQLVKHGQEHLVNFIQELSQAEQLTLVEQIESLDMDLIDSLIKEFVVQSPEIKTPENLEPPFAYPTDPTEDLEDKYKKATARGEQLIAEHKVAAFTVAGGAGTRLNYSGPKGNVAATPLRNKSLFRVFAENILAAQHKFNCIVPWYVMTSKANHEDTVRIFEDNDYYGLDKANVMHFPQGMMPCFSTEGKILLSEKHQLSMSPDGHGGSLRALYQSGACGDMAKRGIEYISYFQIDNPLVNVLDPLFIGLHAIDGSDMSSKAVIKCEPLEKVGNFAMHNGRQMVIEYSDLPDELAHQKDESGKLAFELGSIAIHILSRQFIEKINSKGFSMPWHRAVKRVPFIDTDGNLVQPEDPNAIKLETFVFDALEMAENPVILITSREEEFAPIKNAQGVDSLQSSQRLQIERAASWIEKAGMEVPRKEDGTPDFIIEISPLFAVDANTLIQKRNQLRPLQSGDMVYLG